MRILLVDDDIEIRFALSNVLQMKHKFAVVEASSGLEAIATLDQHQDFTLIISDYQMDNGNGQSIVDYLVQKQITIPLIFFSGSTEVATAAVTPPIVRTFAKSEVFHLIEFVEQFYKSGNSMPVS
jgi:CheY-like chemotaxis protein